MQRVFLFLLASLFLLTGCGSQYVKDAWKYTNRQYRAYLNTPAEIDWENKGSLEAYELSLGRYVMDVDIQIGEFIKVMENSDRRPDLDWVMSTMHRFPWLTGIAVVDGNGNVMAQYPEVFLKQFDVTPLLEPDPKQRMSALRAYVQHSVLGPEIYVANPVYNSEELMGMVVAHFDIRDLLARSPAPDLFMMASPYGVLWGGNFQVEATPVAKEDWGQRLTHESRGFVGEKGSQFFWATRYLGNLPLVYAIPVKGDRFEPDLSNLEELEQVPAVKPKEGASYESRFAPGTPDVTPDNLLPPAPAEEAAPLSE